MFENLILSKKIKEQIEAFKTDNNIALGFYSKGPGTGKSSSAKAFLNNVVSEGWPCVFINSSIDRGISKLEEIQNFMGTKSWTSKYKLIVLDEFDNTTKDFQLGFRGLLDSSKDTKFILTWNYSGSIAEPILDRLIKLDFQNPNKNELLEEAEKLWNPHKNVEISKFIDANFGQFRKIELSLKNLNFESPELDVKKILELDFKELKDLCFQKLDARIFNSILEFSIENPKRLKVSLENVGLLIGKYSYYHSLVMDKGMNILAFLSEFKLNFLAS